MAQVAPAPIPAEHELLGYCVVGQVLHDARARGLIEYGPVVPTAEQAAAVLDEAPLQPGVIWRVAGLRHDGGHVTVDGASRATSDEHAIARVLVTYLLAITAALLGGVSHATWAPTVPGVLVSVGCGMVSMLAVVAVAGIWSRAPRC